MENPELEYIENIKEAPIMFRIVSFEHSSPHWHHEYEAFFILRGSALINCEAGTFDLRKGDILLFNSREIHSIFSAEKNNLCLIMQWSPALFLDVHGFLFRFNLNTRRENNYFPENISLLRRAMVEIGLLLHEKPDGYQFAIKSWLYGFISLLFSSAPYTVVTHYESANEHLDDFDRIQRYIREHFKEDMPIDRLCSEVAMSRAKIFRVLRDAGTGSVKDIQKFYRIEYAKNLLLNTDLTIPYIANESGFESDSSFYRVFKELTGSPPNQYRASPGEQSVPPGIQGYASFRQAEVVKLLKGFC
jgi:AraC-like DNA-binding protein